MPRNNKPSPNVEATEDIQVSTSDKRDNKDELAKLTQLLASVMRYLSDDTVEEIDIEYLLDNTEGLREWWSEYRKKDRKRVEEEIKKSLSDLSMEELEKIRKQIDEADHTPDAQET